MSKIKVVQLILPGLLFSLSFFTAAAFGQGSGSPSTRYDFDGDRKADISVFRPSNGVWWVKRSSDGTDSATNFGLGPDKIVPADYDGDLKADYAVFRNGTWYRLKTLTSTVDVFNFGLSTDIPLPSDFDGDGLSDISVFRPQNGTWHRLNSSNGQYAGLQWGMTGDIPLVGDYDADGKTDFTVFRPSEGNWYHLNSANQSVNVYNFGLLGDIPLAGDFDGDLRFDLAVWRPSSRTWFIKRSSDGGYYSSVFGLPTDIPVPADYDGDGKADISVYRPSDSVWHRINSGTNNYVSAQYGIGADIPVPAPNSSMSTPTPPPSFTCDYFASPTGTSSGTGTITSPWSLQAALNKTQLMTAGKTLCMRGGTYNDKFISTLMGGTVRSYPGEWAKIFGYTPTTLTAAIDATQTSFTVTDSSNVELSGTAGGVTIDGEAIFVTAINGNTIEGFRGASGSYTPASAHSNGATVIPAGGQLFVTGDNTVYRDFEVVGGNPNRLFHAQPRDALGIGIFNVGNGNKFINLIVHDNHNGIFSGTSSSNTEYYGCLVYNNGRTNGTYEESEGSGIYLHNGAGYSRVYEMLVLNGFGSGAGLFGQTGAYVGGDTKGSVFANNGANMGGTARQTNLLVGTNLQQSPTYNLQDSHFFHPHSSNGTLTQMAWGSGIATSTILNNYFVGGGAMLGITNLTQGTITGNRFYSRSNSAMYVQLPNPLSPYTWNNNTYFDADPGRWVYNIGGYGLTDFDDWRVQTTFDATGVRTTSAMPDTVVVRPNTYEAGRCNIIIYAPSAPNSINVNLANCGLTNGQTYTIKNAFNYFGANVASGTYNATSPSISLSLTGAARSVATPIGHGFTPATTLADFGVFIVVPSS